MENHHTKATVPTAFTVGNNQTTRQRDNQATYQSAEHPREQHHKCKNQRCSNEEIKYVHSVAVVGQFLAYGVIIFLFYGFCLCLFSFVDAVELAAVAEVAVCLRAVDVAVAR